MIEVVGWDLDSSLSSTVHRRHIVAAVRAGTSTWDDYSMACRDDPPIEGAVALMQLMVDMDPEVKHIAISGRSERALNLTRSWAIQHRVPLSGYMLRPDGDETPNAEWKAACIRRLQAEGYRVRLFVEDWGPAALEIREKTGIPVLGLNPFDPGSALVTQEQLAEALAGHPAYANADWTEPGQLAADIFKTLPGCL